jgi:hypothetical protein
VAETTSEKKGWAVPVAGVPLRQRIVEVIADLDDTEKPEQRYGSGLLVGGSRRLSRSPWNLAAVQG